MNDHQSPQGKSDIPARHSSQKERKVSFTPSVATTMLKLQQNVGNRMVTRMLSSYVSQAKRTPASHLSSPSAPPAQLAHKEGNAIWSENDKFAAMNEEREKIKLGAVADSLPDLDGVTWKKESGQVEYTKGKKRNRGTSTVKQTLPLWRATWSSDHKDVKIPKDCLMTAELVSAWLSKQDPKEVGNVILPPQIEEADRSTTLGKGDIMFHMHSDDDGDFHAAPIIATDGGDVVTMEGDASSGTKTASMSPLFDIYAGHAGFSKNQNPGRKKGERTYVIHLAEGRDAEDKLWDEIQNTKFSDAGKRAADAIINAIQNARNAQKQQASTSTKKSSSRTRKRPFEDVDVSEQEAGPAAGTGTSSGSGQASEQSTERPKKRSKTEE